MFSARAAFRTNKESSQSGEYTTRKGNKGSCIYNCQTNGFLSSGQFTKKLDLKEVSICQLPFNKLNLNVNLVTKNNFEENCVLQLKSTGSCSPTLDTSLQPLYDYYNLYYNVQNPNGPDCKLYNFNNNWNRVYYPAKENNNFKQI